MICFVGGEEEAAQQGDILDGEGVLQQQVVCDFVGDFPFSIVDEGEDTLEVEIDLAVMVILGSDFFSSINSSLAICSSPSFDISDDLLCNEFASPVIAISTSRSMPRASARASAFVSRSS